MVALPGGSRTLRGVDDFIRMPTWACSNERERSKLVEEEIQVSDELKRRGEQRYGMMYSIGIY